MLGWRKKNRRHYRWAWWRLTPGKSALGLLFLWRRMSLGILVNQGIDCRCPGNRRRRIFYSFESFDRNTIWPHELWNFFFHFICSITRRPTKVLIVRLCYWATLYHQALLWLFGFYKFSAFFFKIWHSFRTFWASLWVNLHNITPQFIFHSPYTHDRW